jgi:hypothetical protein
MGLADAALWHRYITANPGLYTTISYDVHVGHGALTDPEPRDNFAKDLQDLTQKRIDVVAYSPSRNYVIEVKPRASVLAIGQAIVYTDLYVRTFNPHLPTIAAVLTDIPDQDLIQTANEYHVLILQA